MRFWIGSRAALFVVPKTWGPDSQMTDATVRLRPKVGPSIRNALAFGLWAVLGLHAVLLLVLQARPGTASRLCTAGIAALATLTVLWRARQLAPRERSTWLWAAAGVFLWAFAHTVETFIGTSAAASNLGVDPSDFIYVIAAFPLLMAFSTTRETESIRIIFYLRWTQIALAFVLTYYCLYGMSRSAEGAATVMGRIYAVVCALLALMGGMRLFVWETFEERRSIRTMCIFLWSYLPVELGMDYATLHWNLRTGTFADLLWSIPFIATGWLALNMPLDEPQDQPRKTHRRGRLLVETLCPMLITTGIFALAASVTSQHPLLGLSAIFVLLLIQGLQSGVLQLNYLTGQTQLLEREQELQTANAALKQLSQLDPLTSIPNRRRFDVALDETWRTAVRKKHSIALLIIDIDFFKGVNDLHGHPYGDQCIIAVAQILDRQAGRPYDLLARYGGDEFLLLLPDTGVNGANTVAERIHAAVSNLNLENRVSPFGGRLTVSIGIGIVDAKAGVAPDVLVDITDDALYEAKRLGRNQTFTRKP